MWLLRFVLGIFGLGYYLKHGVFDKKRSGLERVTYGFLGIPLVWCYALFGIIIIMTPIVFIGVALQDCPVIGVFLLIAVILFGINVIKRFTDNGNENENENEPYDPSKGEFAQFVKKCKEDSDRKEKEESLADYTKRRIAELNKNSSFKD